MRSVRIFPFCGLLLMIIYCVLEAAPVYAQFQPPNTIRVTMYRLNSGNGSIVTDPKTGKPIPCTEDRDEIAQSYGCTAITNDDTYAYPFDSSTITVTIEGTAANNRYLRDVIAQEMSPTSFLPSALGAQAIAARTYAYWHIRTDSVQPGPINNSNGYQVFLPYRYDQFNDAERAAIDAALQQRFYMSYHHSYSVNIYGQNLTLSESDPVFAEFFADAPAQTVNNTTFSYLTGVEDPISTHPDVTALGHGHGLSQNGAGRWARGSSSYRCNPAPAPCQPTPSTPHTAWSVRWNNPLQVLTHYYSGIEIRDTNNQSALVAPAYRWVPLGMTWAPGGDAPPTLCRNQPATVEVWVQNSGTTTWNLNANAADQVTLSYSATPNPGSPTSTALVADAQQSTLAPGQDAVFPLTISLPDPGSYELRFDMYVGDQRFSTREVERPWPVYDLLDITILPCVFDKFTYLPVIQAQLATNNTQ